MKKVIYRAIEKKDYLEVQNLICISFGLDSYVSDSKTLKLITKQYLCSCLTEQTYNKVAEIDGKIIGVIMGASDHAKHTVINILNALKSLFYSLQIILFHRKACDS